MSENSPVNGAAAGPLTGKRSQQKRALILNAAMSHFAEHGYEAARVGDMASHLGIAKGSVFQHFGSKDGLFFEAYKSALRALPPYLDVPNEVKNEGFFAVARYRLSRPAEFWEEYRVPYRIVLLGNYGSDLNLKKRIVRFVAAEDPLGAAAFVKMGVERGEVRTDVDAWLITSMLECTFERMQDFLVTAEFDPTLFDRAAAAERSRAQIVEQFVTVLRGAIGAATHA
jgi:TetR/AcrR family transcriptional regulator